MINSFSGNYRFLSNFYPASVLYEGLTYPSVEHAYQAAKTLDMDYRDIIRRAPSPAQAKAIGRTVSLREDWEEVKIETMRTLIKQKFSDPVLAQKLLSTGTELLIEGNTWGDRFWGQDINGRGLNWLGKLLMEVRHEIKEV